VGVRVTTADPNAMQATINAAGGVMTLNGGACNGLSCAKGGVPVTLAGCTVSNDIIRLPVPAGVVPGASDYTCSYDPASGNITNGTTELAAFTNQSVVNDVLPVSLVRSGYALRVCQYNEPLCTPDAQQENSGAGYEVRPGGAGLLLLGIAYTGDDSPHEGLSLRCVDTPASTGTPGTPYEPGGEFLTRLTRYVDSPTFANNTVLATRPFATDPGTTYDADGRARDLPGTFPTKIHTQDTDTAIGVSLQVSSDALEGDTVECYPVVDNSTVMHSRTPAAGTPTLVVRTKKAGGF
jgi:hypothetical protein